MPFYSHIPPPGYQYHPQNHPPPGTRYYYYVVPPVKYISSSLLIEILFLFFFSKLPWYFFVVPPSPPLKSDKFIHHARFLNLDLFSIFRAGPRPNGPRPWLGQCPRRPSLFVKGIRSVPYYFNKGSSYSLVNKNAE